VVLTHPSVADLPQALPRLHHYLLLLELVPGVHHHPLPARHRLLDLLPHLLHQVLVGEGAELEDRRHLFLLPVFRQFLEGKLQLVNEVFGFVSNYGPQPPVDLEYKVLELLGLIDWAVVVGGEEAGLEVELEGGVLPVLHDLHHDGGGLLLVVDQQQHEVLVALEPFVELLEEDEDGEAEVADEDADDLEGLLADVHLVDGRNQLPHRRQVHVELARPVPLRADYPQHLLLLHHYQ
jgi:hypothetical protein